MRIFLIIVAIVAVGVAGLAVASWRSEIDPVQPPQAETFDEAIVAEGARLAALGNCVDCHTAPDGAAYAGGYPMNTPYGVIYGTNITPDVETGIGNWSEAAFVRAMREGVDREGRHLYPAFPYDQFTIVSDEDLHALYAYFMTREPVRYEAPAPEVPFPLGFRPLLAGWKMLFHEERRFEPNPERTAEWNRGAYLADGLAHCGACHTPRNPLGAREEARYLAGGESENWYAPPLNAASPAPEPWTEEALSAYLRAGVSPDHATAAGPMAPVVRNLARVPEDDVQALSIYIADVIRPEEGSGQVDVETTGATDALAGADLDRARTLYDGACAVCHEPAGGLYFSARVPLGQATSIEYADPRNLVHVILDGLEQPLVPGEPLMPGFDAALDDEQVALLAAYLRDRFSDRPLWHDFDAAAVGDIRDERNAMRQRPRHDTELEARQ